MLFKDREDAGNQLAQKLSSYRNAKDTVVLGLARGGVVTAAAVARELGLPLDVMIVKKLGASGQEELAIGGLAATGERVLNERLVQELAVAPAYVEAATAKARRECAHREALYRKHQPAVPLNGKTVLLVDDGIATGLTMEAAIASVRGQGAGRIVVAVPVLPADTVSILQKLVDELIYVQAPEYFGAVGSFYDQFLQVEHDEVLQVLGEFKVY